MDDVAAALSVEYEKAKENLKGVDDNIIKLYGRDPNDNNNKRLQRRVSRTGGNVGVKQPGGASAGRLFGEARRIINNPNREPIGGPVGMDRGRGPARRVSVGDRLGGIQSRLGPKRGRPADSGDEEDPLPRKMVVPSAVVMPTVEIPKREDSVAMKPDKKVMARNRRMFGALLGTLQSFQKDSKKEEDKEKRRAEVERKLEEKQRNEEFQLRRDKAALWNERREKQNQLRQLEAKMKLVKSFEEWERIVRDQANFIKTTRGKYHIYYMPKSLLPSNVKALEATEDYVEDMVNRRKQKLQEDIERIMSAQVRRREPRTTDPNSQGQNDSDKSENSDSDSSRSDGSDLEEGEVSSRRQARAAEAELSVPVKVEKEEVLEVKKEMEEANEETVTSKQVGNGVIDEVRAESDDEMNASFQSKTSRKSADEVGESVKQARRVDSVAQRSRRKKDVGLRRSRSSSSSSRSRSRSRERPPPRRKAGKKSKANQSSSGSSSSSSGSSFSSGTSSGSDSEPPGKSPKSGDE